VWAQTHGKDMLTWHLSDPLACFSLSCTWWGHTAKTSPCVHGGDTRQRFFTVVFAAVCGPPCVHTRWRFRRVPNHFCRVFYPQGKEFDSDSALCVLTVPNDLIPFSYSSSGYFL
jgi:hypothetical protein